MIDPSQRIEEALDICLTRMIAGESAETCMRDFPQYADELEPLLAAMVQVRGWSPPELSARTRTAARTRARVALRRTHRRPQTTWSWGGWALRLGAAAILAIALFSGGITFAGASLPGSPLYGLKRVGESTRLTFVGTSTDRALLNMALAQLRVDEMIAVAKGGRSVDLNLLADLDGFYLAAAQAITETDAQNQPDLLMRYRAQLEANHVALTEAQQAMNLSDAARRALEAASKIRIIADTLLTGLDPSPEPVDNPTATPAATMTVTVVATTAVATATARPEPSATLLATATAVPMDTATSTKTPVPTSRPPATLRPRPRPTLAPTLTATAPPEPTAEPTVEPTAEPTVEPPPEPTQEGGDEQRNSVTPEPTSNNSDNQQPPETNTPEPKRTDLPKPPESSTPEPSQPPLPTQAETPRPEESTHTPQSQATNTPKPDNTTSPEPEHTKSPEPDNTTSPEPEHTKSPEPDHDPTATRRP